MSSDPWDIGEPITPDSLKGFPYYMIGGAQPLPIGESRVGNVEFKIEQGTRHGPDDRIIHVAIPKWTRLTDQELAAIIMKFLHNESIHRPPPATLKNVYSTRRPAS